MNGRTDTAMTSAMKISERQINTIARWLHLHECCGDRALANRTWGGEDDYADAFQEGFRREARRLAEELLKDNEEREPDTP